SQRSGAMMAPPRGFFLRGFRFSILSQCETPEVPGMARQALAGCVGEMKVSVVAMRPAMASLVSMGPAYRLGCPSSTSDRGPGVPPAHRRPSVARGARPREGDLGAGLRGEPDVLEPGPARQPADHAGPRLVEHGEPPGAAVDLDPPARRDLAIPGQGPV